MAESAVATMIEPTKPVIEMEIAIVVKYPKMYPICSLLSYSIVLSLISNQGLKSCSVYGMMVFMAYVIRVIIFWMRL